MKISVNKNKVGFRINQFRTNKGYTLEDFGELFNTSKSNVHRWEKGLALPNKDRLVKISKLMGITLNELLYGSVEEFTRENYKNIASEAQLDLYSEEPQKWAIKLIEEELKEEGKTIEDIEEVIYLMELHFNVFPTEELEFDTSLDTVINFLDYKDKQKVGELILNLIFKKDPQAHKSYIKKELNAFTQHLSLDLKDYIKNNEEISK